MEQSKYKTRIGVVKKAGIILFWLVIWQLISVLINNQFLLAGPIESIIALGKMIPTSDFWL